LLEGIHLHTLAIPKRIVGSDGRVSGIEWLKARLGPADDSGRRRPIAIEGSESLLACDRVITAVGQRASIEPVEWENGPQLTSWKTLKIDPVTRETSVPGIYAGGDCVTGGTTVIEAIADGQRAAISIDLYLGGSGQLPPDTGWSFSRLRDLSGQEMVGGLQEDSLPITDRQLSFEEVIRGVSESRALCEASRCLRCDLEKALAGKCKTK